LQEIIYDISVFFNPRLYHHAESVLDALNITEFQHNCNPFYDAYNSTESGPRWTKYQGQSYVLTQSWLTSALRDHE